MAKGRNNVCIKPIDIVLSHLNRILGNKAFGFIIRRALK